MIISVSQSRETVSQLKKAGSGEKASGQVWSSQYMSRRHAILVRLWQLISLKHRALVQTWESGTARINSSCQSERRNAQQERIIRPCSVIQTWQGNLQCFEGDDICTLSITHHRSRPNYWLFTLDQDRCTLIGLSGSSYTISMVDLFKNSVWASWGNFWMTS